MKDYYYYLVFEKHITPTHYTKSWLIRKTSNDMDSLDGLRKEIEALEDSMGEIWLINWKRLTI